MLGLCERHQIAYIDSDMLVAGMGDFADLAHHNLRRTRASLGSLSLSFAFQYQIVVRGEVLGY